MADIRIEQPIWNSRSVGLNLEGLPPSQVVSIRITYKNKNNQYVYPNVFRMKVYEIINASTKTQMRRNKTKLYIVPISALKVTDEVQKD